MPTRRHKNALGRLTSFAPLGIIADLAEACTEICDDPVFNNTNAMREDPAVRLLAYRLAQICGITVPDVPVYDRLVDYCQELERRAKAGG